MDLNPSLKTMVDQIADIGQNMSHDRVPSPETHRELQDLTRKMSFALERPHETMWRLVFVPFQHATVRIGIDLGLFQYLLDAGPNGKTVDELARKTGVDEILLPRLLRSSAAIGLLLQLDQDRWAATPLSQACVIPTLRSGIKFMFDFVGPVFQKLPEYLSRTQYRCPTPKEGPLQHAWDTKLSGFDYLMEPQNADTVNDLSLFMKGRREGTAIWLDFYPFAENILASNKSGENSVTVVDVGGGLGHGLLEICERFPDIHGRLILQDFPKTVQQAVEEVGVKGRFEPMAHDFFSPQPVQGARAYLIRQVLHDWPDKECVVILKHLAAALSRGYSKILINEFVVPATGASGFVSGCDLMMMGLGGGMERTEAQWQGLLNSAGLSIERIWSLDELTESLIEAVLL